MKNTRLKRLFRYAIYILLLLVPLSTMLTQYLYSRFEGKDISFAQSLVFVIQTFTTTGYGELLPFKSTVMNLYAILLIFTGLGLIFIVLTTAATQWLNEHFEEMPPQELKRKLKGHIILCGYNAFTEAVIEEIEGHDALFLVVEKNPEIAREIMYKDVPLLFGDPSESAVLSNAGISDASAVISCLSDGQNIRIILEARALASAPVYSVVDDSSYLDKLILAGATREIFPKHILGEALARWALSVFDSRFYSAMKDTGELTIMEFAIGQRCIFADKTLRESRIRELTGVTVLGFWNDGFFSMTEGADTFISRESIAVVVGTPAQLENLSASMSDRPRNLTDPDGLFIIAGYGEAARRVIQILKENGKQVRIIIKTGGVGDEFITGDITSPDTLRKAGIEHAAAFMVSVDSDDEAILSVLTARSLNTDIRIAARVNSHQSAQKLYRAGADFVLSFSNVGARMISTMLFGEHKKDMASLDIEFFEMPVSESLAGKTIAASRIFDDTGSLIVGIRRDGSVMANPSPDTRIAQDDVLIMLGNADKIQQTEKTLF